MTSLGSRVSRLSPSYWLVQLADMSTGDRKLTESMRQELDRQVTVGLPRVDLRSQYGALTFMYLLPMAVVAFGMWLLSATVGIGASARFVGVTLIAYCGISAVWSGLRWLTCPEDQETVVWHPWLVDGVVLLAALGLAAIPTA